MTADCDLLIIGGGPTGVTLALIAAQAGASVIICEKEGDIFSLPRAAHIDHEVMRIFQSVGAADEIAKTCRTTERYDFLTRDGQILLRFDGSDRIGPGGWPGANMIHQPSLERALRDRLAFQPGAKLRLGWRFVGMDTTENGVSARFQTPEGDRHISAHYLVGADGTRSPVRQAAGLHLQDLGFDEPWLVVDALVQDASRLPTVNLQICDPARPTTCVLMGAGRHRWEFMLLPGETPEQVSADAFVDKLLEPWNVKGAISIERKAVYQFNARVATTWRQGRVLLAGDAAHQTPPFAGQGLCAGVRDAANLGWKIGQIISGRASPNILDTYQSERAPHALATIQIAIMMGRTVCLTDPAAAARRDQDMLAARAAGQSPDGPPGSPPYESGVILASSPAAGSYFPQLVSDQDGQKLDDRLGPRAWLIGRSVSADLVANPGLRVIGLDEPGLCLFRAGLENWLARHQAEAVIVRPDRYVFGTGPAEVLIRSWSDTQSA